MEIQVFTATDVADQADFSRIGQECLYALRDLILLNISGARSVPKYLDRWKTAVFVLLVDSIERCNSKDGQLSPRCQLGRWSGIRV